MKMSWILGIMFSSGSHISRHLFVSLLASFSSSHAFMKATASELCSTRESLKIKYIFENISLIFILLH